MNKLKQNCIKMAKEETSTVVFFFIIYLFETEIYQTA